MTAVFAGLKLDSRRVFVRNDVVGHYCLFDGITKCVTSKDVALLDAWRLAGRHPYQNIDNFLKPSACRSGEEQW